MTVGEQRLATAQRLSIQVRREVKDLVALCREHEPIDLPLLLDPSISIPDDQDLYFLVYEKDAMVGAASTWPGSQIEVIGAVHPQHRRRGFGRRLLEALKLECRRRGVESLLLVCETGAPSGAAFAEAMGARHEFSEYRMELDRAVYARKPRPPRTLDVRQADRSDLEALVALWTASSEVDESEARATTLDWLEQANQRFYIGWFEGRAVGSVRLYLGDSGVYPNSFRVRPELRGRGYGRQILMDVLDELIAEDWPRILIEVATDNLVALSLYHSCGYREIATFQYYRLTARDA
jgi:ribosomal protein S18 acetylase RimI-like enzyme